MRNILLISVIVILLVLNMFVFFVDQTEYAIVLRFGEFKREIKEPGLNYRIPFVETVVFFQNKVLDYDSEPATIITKDKKTMIVDNFAKWKIIDPLKFFKSAVNEVGMIGRLDDIVYSKLRSELGGFEFIDIISSKRTVIMENVTRQSNELAAEYGVEIIDVRIKRADLPQENEEAVFNEMRTERNMFARQYRAEGREEAKDITSQADTEVEEIKSAAYKESQNIIGEAEKEAIKIYADAYEEGEEFYFFLKKLEIMEKTFNEETKVILSTDSELFDLLNNFEI
ncbi:MAG: protease modulator HflC [Candidatus Muiribacteriota bacterium]